METKEGFEFVCKILETIMRDTDGEEYQIIKYARKNGDKIGKKYEENIDKLIYKWKQYSKKVLITYNKIVLEEGESDKKQKSDGQQMLDDYVDWLKFSEEKNPKRFNKKDYTNFRNGIKKYINGISSNNSDKKANKKRENQKNTERVELNIDGAFKSILMQHKATMDAFSA